RAAEALACRTLPAAQCAGDPALDLGRLDPFLHHRVALADRHHVVLQRVAVDRDAEGRADLVLAAVAPADRPALVVVGAQARGAQQALDLGGPLRDALRLDQS